MYNYIEGGIILENNIDHKHIEEALIITLFLTFIGGFLDAYTYILYDKIFANTQTGNIILFTINLVDGNFKEAFYRFLPILAFCIGIFIAQYFIYKFDKRKLYVKIILFLNSVITLFIGIGFFKNHYIVITCLISFICSTLIAVFKKAEGHVFAPVMCTGNLRSFMEFLFSYVIHKEEKYKKVCFKYLNIILTFCFGVAFGIISVNYLRNYAILICSFIFIGIYIFIHKKIRK